MTAWGTFKYVCDSNSNYQELMLPVLKFAAQREQRVPDLAEKIADDTNLSTDLRDEMVPSDKQKISQAYSLDKIFIWVKRGCWYRHQEAVGSSDDGHALLLSNAAKIDVSLLMKSPDFKAFYEMNSRLRKQLIAGHRDPT